MRSESGADPRKTGRQIRTTRLRRTSNKTIQGTIISNSKAWREAVGEEVTLGELRRPKSGYGRFEYRRTQLRRSAGRLELSGNINIDPAVLRLPRRPLPLCQCRIASSWTNEQQNPTRGYVQALAETHANKVTILARSSLSSDKATHQ